MRSCITGITPEWFELPNQKGDADPVKFLIRPLNGMEGADIVLNSYDVRTGSINQSGIITAFKLCVQDWKNISGPGPSGLLEYSKQAILSLRTPWILEVGARILEISKINEDGSKNSDLPS